MVWSDFNFSDLTTVTSFDSVVKELNKLNGYFLQNNMENYLVFNNAYRVVTLNIKASVNEGHFDNDQFIENFTAGFARYYFQAINHISTEDPNVAESWKKFAEVATVDTSPKFILLLMGANAHINHDLPFALLKFIDEGEVMPLLGDIVKLSKIMMESGREIIPLFNEQNRFLNTFKNRFQFLYYRPIMYTVLSWRIVAWRAFKHLSNGNPGYQAHIKRSKRIAQRYLVMGKLLSRI
ncbi:MAG: hypothetical protein HKL80_09390 [Acidimicrobiales bacterium]|nr:hypothetical protein [Acidimicrobiales bacterium]